MRCGGGRTIRLRSSGHLDLLLRAEIQPAGAHGRRRRHGGACQLLRRRRYDVAYRLLRRWRYGVAYRLRYRQRRARRVRCAQAQGVGSDLGWRACVPNAARHGTLL